MKDKKKKIMIIITAVVVVIIAVVLIVTHFSEPEPEVKEDEETHEPVNISIRDNGIENNPKDYSQLEPGTTFYDEFWHGEVTIVGKQTEVDYDKMLDEANGRLITTQDGMFIYVDRSADEDDKSEQEETTDHPLDQEVTSDNNDDVSFYNNTPSVDIEKIESVALNSSSTLPSCAWRGVRYAVKQYLIDINLPDVTTLTVKDNTQTTAGMRTGFQCSMNNQAGTIGVYFNKDNCRWRFMYSKTDDISDAEGYMEYNPIRFVAPSTRQAACEELNELIGYDRFTVEDAMNETSQVVTKEEPEPKEDDAADAKDTKKDKASTATTSTSQNETSQSTTSVANQEVKAP